MKKLVHKLCLFGAMLCASSIAWGQDASISCPVTNFGASTTISGVIFTNSGGSFSSSSYSNCSACTSGNTLRVDSSGDYLQIQSTLGDLDHITFTIGSNSTTGATALLQFSVDGTTWTNDQQLALPANNANPACQTHDVTAPAGMKYARLTRNGQTIRVFNASVWLKSGNPTLSVTPTSITTLASNLYDNSQSVSSFTLTGSNLTANATVTAPANYQVSLNGTSGWGASVTVTQTAGAINAPVYVRINPLYTTVGTVPSGNVTFASTGVINPTPVALSGTVVNATPLPTPATPAASAPTTNGFTATWTTVANATGYTITVYDGSTPVKTLTGLSGTTTTVTGLNASTTYTFTLTAEGNNITNANSAPSSNSNSVTTLAPPPSTSPCAITLYVTDFSNWAPVTNQNTSGNALPVTTGGGAGFIITTDVSVIPNDNKLVYASTSERTLTFPSFVFANGGSVIIKGKNTTNSSMGGFAGATVTDASTGAPVTLSTVRSGDANGGAYYLKFTLPNAVNGATALEYKTRGEIYEIIVCTNPNGSPQIATFPVGGQTVAFAAPTGGNVNTQYINLKGFNLTGDVHIEIIGGDGRFSVSQADIARAIAEGGIDLPVRYTSSIAVSAHDAIIRFTSPGANTVEVNLHGVSRPAGGGCAFTTSDATQIFSTRIITPTTKTINISGYNLPANVALSITGAGAVQFSLSKTIVTQDKANTTGDNVTITYLGGTEVGIHNANLVLTSGSCSITIPLEGQTRAYNVVLYTLVTIANPTGSGTFTTNIAGPQYPSGTVVRLNAIAEEGYKFVRWNDITSYSPVRNITMNANKTITAVFVPSTDPGAKGDLEAYNITGVTATGFTANWKPVTGATQYTVNVYEQDANGRPGNLAKTQNVTGQATASLAITGLTQGKAYFYQVVANTTLGDTSEMLGSYPIGPLQSIVCGVEP